ncbi:MAG: PH domain-containing protein [Chloroflexota bacterium]
MGYMDKLMGRNEQIQFVARQHWVMLLLRIFGSLFAFLVFLTLWLVVRSDASDTVNVVGIIVLGALLLPVYQIVSTVIKGRRGSELLALIWRPVLIGVFMLIMGLALLLTPTAWETVALIALLLSILPLINTVRIFLDWFNERYTVTNRRVILIKGIINKHVSDSALEKVNDVILIQSVLGRLLGYGDVEIITGSDVGVNLFKRMDRPVDFKREMLNQKESLGHAEPEVIEDVPELIKKLDELRRQGILSDEEFETKKRELLDQL